LATEDKTRDVSPSKNSRYLNIISQLASQTIDSDVAMSLANDLLRITDPTRDVLVMSGDLYTAVDILQNLGQKTIKNVTMNEEKAGKFMKVSRSSKRSKF